MSPKARIDEFFSLCRDLMCVLNRDGSFELTNDALAELLEPDGTPSKPFVQYVHPDDRPSSEEALGRAFRAADDDVRFVNRFRGKDGGYDVVQWRGRADPDSGLLYLLGVDITSEQKTAQALRESRRNLEALVQVAAQGILTVDPSGKILTSNPMAARIFGYERDELVGMSIESLLPESARGVHSHHRAEYTKAPRPRAMGLGMDLKGYRKDGTTVPLEISLSHYATDRGFVVVALVSDITERLRAENETRQLERRLEHATKMEAVGRLAGGIAHDFNNLLTALSGFAEIVLDELPEDHPLCEGAREVRRTCQRSVSMVRRLLSASRRQVSQPVVLDVGTKISELSTMLRGLLGEDVKLEVTLDPSAPRAVLDESQLEQVLLNLVVNAKDALFVRGRIAINVVAHENDGMRFVKLRVADDGRGMSETVLSQIFEPFFTTREHGTGLGLATVKSIVDRSGGTIHVSSKEGEGTTFEVLFPEHRGELLRGTGDESASREAVADRSSGRERRSGTILVAESENSVRLVAVQSLRRAGYHVLEAKDGEEALRLAGEHEGTLDLILTDVVMPRASGPELVTQLRKRHPRLRALFMSGYPKDALAQHGLRDFTSSFIEKPFSREFLTSSVRRALES